MNWIAKHHRVLFAAACLLFVVFSIQGATGRADAPATMQQPAPDAAHREAFFRKNLVDAYEKIGRKNPKWDENARAVLEMAVQRWMAAGTDPDVEWKMMVRGDLASKAGCDDPAVLYATLRAYFGRAMQPDLPLLTALEGGIRDCKYAPFVKVFALTRLTSYVSRMASGDEARALTQRLVQGVYGNLPAMAQGHDFPTDQLVDICADLTDAASAMDGDRKPMIDKIYAMLPP